MLHDTRLTTHEASGIRTVDEMLEAPAAIIR